MNSCSPIWMEPSTKANWGLWRGQLIRIVGDGEWEGGGEAGAEEVGWCLHYKNPPMYKLDQYTGYI